VVAHAQIVNLSLGGPADPLLSQLVSYGLQHGMIFVGAVPESGRLDGFPLGISGVIAVDQIGRSGHTTGVLYAPGHDIVSTAPGGSYDFVTGSSFATAHVTGAIALLRSRVPNLSSTAIYAVLDGTRTRQGSQEVNDSINVCAALDALQPGDNCMHSARAVATAAH
jgi:subtilisin family serine protease